MEARKLEPFEITQEATLMSNEVNVTQISFTMKQAVTIAGVLITLTIGAVSGYYGMIYRIDKLSDDVSALKTDMREVKEGIQILLKK